MFVDCGLGRIFVVLRCLPKNYTNLFCPLVISIVWRDSVHQRSLAERGFIPDWILALENLGRLPPPLRAHSWYRPCPSFPHGNQIGLKSVKITRPCDKPNKHTVFAFDCLGMSWFQINGFRRRKCGGHYISQISVCANVLYKLLPKLAKHLFHLYSCNFTFYCWWKYQKYKTSYFSNKVYPFLDFV